MLIPTCMVLFQYEKELYIVLCCAECRGCAVLNSVLNYCVVVFRSQLL